MAKKKKKSEDPEKENSERWLLTYSDMITLLMLFFIILYAMSTVDSKKYEELSSALAGVLGGANMGYVLSSDNGKGTQGNMGQKNEQNDPSKARKRDKDAIRVEMESRLRTMVQIPEIQIMDTEEGLRISLYSDLFFNSGDAVLTDDATQKLVRVANALEVFPNLLRIEGHADASPVDTDKYPSNWELSGARAYAVLHLLEDLGIDSHRMSAVAYGENRPILDDGESEGRAYNRRVDIMLLWEKDDY